MINVIWHNNDIQIIKTIKHVKHKIKLEINVMRPSNKTSKNYRGNVGCIAHLVHGTTTGQIGTSSNLCFLMYPMFSILKIRTQ